MAKYCSVLFKSLFATLVFVFVYWWWLLGCSKTMVKVKCSSMSGACTRNHRLWPPPTQTSLQVGGADSPQNINIFIYFDIYLYIREARKWRQIWARGLRIVTLTCLPGTVLLAGTGEKRERIYLIRFAFHLSHFSFISDIFGKLWIYLTRLLFMFPLVFPQ